MELILIILGLIIGCFITYLLIKPKLNKVQSFNQAIEEQRQQLQNTIQLLQEERESLYNACNNITNSITEKKLEHAKLQSAIDTITENIEDMRKSAELTAQEIYKNAMLVMQDNLENAAINEANKFQKAKEQAEKEYLNSLAESSNQIAAALTLRRQEVSSVEEQLATLRAKADAAIAAAKREEEKLLEIDKYKILVTDLDLLEINRLREIAPYFRNARAIYKIIWETYYRNLTTEMINRVVGAGTHTGVYKLTNLKNQKVYIGQAADISERFKQHIKCGLGIDTPSNMLYTAMMKDGVENFTFEVLEECDRATLNDREKYYISFYRAQEHGYNMSRGGARN